MVRINDLDSKIFNILLQYIYTDEMDEQLPLETIMNVFIAADRFGIDRLKRIAELYILMSLSVENACGIFQAADMHAAVTLRRKSLDFIGRNYDTVIKSESFEELARSNIELTLEIIRLR